MNKQLAIHLIGMIAVEQTRPEVYLPSLAPACSAIAPDFEGEALEAFAAAGVRTMKLALDRPFNTRMCDCVRVPSLSW